MPRLRQIYALNTEVTLLAEGADDGDLVIVVDVSSSMAPHADDLRVALSAARVCADNAAHTVVHLPPPSGRTHLVSCMERLVARVPPSTKVLILTDGEDTEDARTSIPVGVDPLTQQLIFKEVTTLEERRTAVVDFLEKVALCEVHVLGYGDEVKALVQKISNRPNLVAGLIARGTSPRDLLAVMKAVINAPSSVNDVITVDSPHLPSPCAEDEQALQQLNRGKQNVIVSSRIPVTAAELVARLDQCDETLATPKCAYTRSALAWFFGELTKHDEGLPGALIGGSRTRIFRGPPNRRRWSNEINALLTLLRTQGILDAQGRHETFEVTIAGKHFKYRQVIVYTLGKCVPLAATEELLRMTGPPIEGADRNHAPPNKRARNAV